MTGCIQFGSMEINYSVLRSDRKTLGITVTPDLEVMVNAPEGASNEKIKEKVKKRASWILKQHDFFLSFHPRLLPKKYISGESHLYLGRQYLLKVIVGSKEEVRYKGRYIEVTAKSKERAKPLLEAWYRERSKLKFAEIAEPVINRFARHGVEPSSIQIQEMKLRWGSCTPKGKIILNPELIKAPKPCIEYVITHELCHLIHHDHSQKFFDLQSKEMPDWEKWKKKLEILLA